MNSFSLMRYFGWSTRILRRPLSGGCHGLTSASQKDCLHLESTLATSNSRRKLSSLCQLQSRSLIQLSGHDTIPFMQGLVTNDVHRLAEKRPSTQYCMILNVQGRVLYDLFMYNISTEDMTTVLIDVDKAGKDDLLKLLKRYKLRKKIQIEDASDQYKLWYQFSSSIPEGSEKTPLTFHDPRVPMLGCRFITGHDDKAEAASTEVADEEAYVAWRYRWGIPEGVLDLPPGNCLPLESNLAIMNGVNFQKGCYVGQELTARTFHTGVIRKRLVPLQLEEEAEVEADTTILTKSKGKNAGKFRQAVGAYGLGLVRLAYLKEELVVTAKDGRSIGVRASVPEWWPAGLV